MEVEQLAETPEFASGLGLLTNVQKEAVALFQKWIGVRITDLQQVTVITPSVELLAESGDLPNVAVAFSFRRSFRAAQVVEAVAAGWTVRQAAGRSYRSHADNGATLYVHSDRVFVFGSEAAVTRLLELQGESGPLDDYIQAASDHQITIGANGAGVPAELRQAVPEPFQALAQTQAACVTVNLDDGLSLGVRLQFESPRQARETRLNLQALRDLARSELSRQSEPFTQAIRTALDSETTERGVGDAIGGLVALSMMRHIDSALDQLQLTEEGVEVVADVELDQSFTSPATLVLISLSAIQAIGSSANTTFSDVTEQLEAPAVEVAR